MNPPSHETPFFVPAPGPATTPETFGPSPFRVPGPSLKLAERPYSRIDLSAARARVQAAAETTQTRKLVFVGTMPPDEFAEFCRGTMNGVVPQEGGVSGTVNVWIYA